jgi:hypothetical protein
MRQKSKNFELYFECFVKFTLSRSQALRAQIENSGTYSYLITG